MTHGLQIPGDALSAVVDDVRFHGRRGVETGAMLLTRPGENGVELVAIAGDRGVTREYGLFVLSSASLAPLFDLAEEGGLQLRAQIHSHGHAAFLSRTDRSGNIRMPGFVASVIPHFTDPTDDVRQWGWWVFEVDDWISAAPASVSASQARVVRFDADGVHEQ